MLFKLIIIGIIALTGYMAYYYTLPYQDIQTPVTYAEDNTEFRIIPTVEPVQITSTLSNSTDDNYTSTIQAKPTWKDAIRNRLESEDRTIKYQEIRQQYYNTTRISIKKTECIPVNDIIKPVSSPIVSGSLGTNGWYNSDVTVMFNAIDDCSGIKEIIAYQQGKATRYNKYHILQPNQTITYSSYLDKSYPKGTVRISYYSIDNQLNIEDKKTLDIHIDVGQPYLSIMNEAFPIRLNEGYSNITIHSSDYHSGIDRIEIIPCKTTATICEPVIYSFEMDDKISKAHSVYLTYTQKFNRGIYTFTVTVYDYAGNINAKVFPVWVDFNPSSIYYN